MLCATLLFNSVLVRLTTVGRMQASLCTAVLRMQLQNFEGVLRPVCVSADLARLIPEVPSVLPTSQVDVVLVTCAFALARVADSGRCGWRAARQFPS
jgi:hypothetical protein